jgi:hypothetical protein
MMTPRRVRATLIAVGCALVTADVSVADILFRKASRDYDESGELGRAYTREYESRMFTHRSWRQRLWCYRDHSDDMNDTLEVYSRADGSRWLSYRHARPSLTREINRRYFVHEQFDLKKSLDSIPVTGGDIRLPPSVATEIESLWKIMLPGLRREPQSNTRIIIVNGPAFIGFRRDGRSVVAGTLADVAYGTRAYRNFVDIVDDLTDSCRASGRARDAILARLPQKMQKLRTRLSKSSNHAIQRTASKAAISVRPVRHPRFGRVAACSGLAVADLESR